MPETVLWAALFERSMHYEVVDSLLNVACVADKAGALLGDLVVELEGKRAENMRQVQELLSSAKIGDKVALTLLRGGSPIHIVVVLGDRPAR